MSQKEKEELKRLLKEMGRSKEELDDIIIETKKLFFL